MTKPDATHSPALRSWVLSANLPTTDFPIQNLPFGRFVRADTDVYDPTSSTRTPF